MTILYNLTGADPRHSDAFQTVKQQIEKISGTDYQLVAQQCQLILAEQAKDLRVAGYLVLAATQLHGMAGFIESIEAYQLLISQFGENLHPQRLDAKIATLKWLNNPRLNTLLGNLENLSDANMERLSLLIPAFNATIKQYFNEDLNLFANLIPAINFQRQKQQAKQQERKLQESEQNNNGSFNSYGEIENAAIGIIRYYQQQNNLIAAAMHARALRWGDMKLPPHEEFRTKIPAPRANGLAKLENLIGENNTKAIYLHCEELLLEPGYHLLLDLQLHACNAAKAMENENLALYLEIAIKDLLKRFPLLIELQFDNQKPFADVQTKSWLYELLSENHSVDSSANETPEHLIPENIIRMAKQNAAKKNLPMLIAYITNLATKGGCDEFQKKHAMAKLCLEYKRADLAVSLLEKLEEMISDHQLFIWQSELVLNVYLDLFNALNILLKKTNDNSKIMLQEKVDRVKNLISQLDITQAIQLF